MNGFVANSISDRTKVGARSAISSRHRTIQWEFLTFPLDCFDITIAQGISEIPPNRLVDFEQSDSQRQNIQQGGRTYQRNS